MKSWGSKGAGAGQFEDSKGVAIYGDTLYVVDPTRVQRFDLDGDYLGEFGAAGGTGQLSNAWAVTVDQDGYVYMSEILDHRIQKFTADGEFVVVLTSDRTGMPAFAAPMGVAVTGDGTLYAVSNLLDGIMIISPELAPVN